MKPLRNLLLLSAGALLLATACEKESDSNTASTATTPVKVRMTDAPASYDQVNVDITGVEFKVNGETTVNLNVNPGIYNLLDFVNGVDTLIASADVPSGELSQVRLILGPNNSIVVDGQPYPLETPSAMQSGLKLNVHTMLQPGVLYELLLDFDANQSIVVEGNGTYKLKPVIRVISTATSGSISGSITPELALPATISATNSTSTTTYTTVTDADGHFLLRGLAAGTYSVTVTPEAPFPSTTIDNVNVTIGSLTDLGVIVF